MSKVKVDAFPTRLGSPRQLMVRDGRLVTLDGKEPCLVGFKEGAVVNVVTHEWLEHLKTMAMLAENWAA